MPTLKLCVAVTTFFFLATSVGCESKPSETGTPSKPNSSLSTTTTILSSDTPEQVAKPTGAAEPVEPAKPVPPALLAPDKATAKAPAKFKVKFETTQGEFIVEVTRAWAPNGADRFYNLVTLGYFEDIAFFRVIEGFMVQFGIHGAPEVNNAWRVARIQDDPVKESNKRGYITFATSGANSRTVQMFINFDDNTRLDRQGFSPFGQVASGMDVVDKLYKGYGEASPGGMGPDQNRIQGEGNAYLKKVYPKLDYIKSASLAK